MYNGDQLACCSRFLSAAPDLAGMLVIAVSSYWSSPCAANIQGQDPSVSCYLSCYGGSQEQGGEKEESPCLLVRFDLTCDILRSGAQDRCTPAAASNVCTKLPVSLQLWCQWRFQQRSCCHRQTQSGARMSSLRPGVQASPALQRAYC